jgi:lipid-binding SYLF domain-containing protein
MRTVQIMIRFVSILLAAAVAVSVPALAATEQEELVEKARFTVEKLATHSKFGANVQNYLGQAKAVVVIPMLLKGGFFLGGEGGSGVLLARAASGEWSYPTFLTMGAGSIGLQFGAQTSELLLIILTDRGLASILDRQVKVGGEINAAIGPIGGGMEAATAGSLGTDIISYSVAKGVFIGGSIEGALIAKRDDWNSGYYKDDSATPRSIVIEGRFGNPQADALRRSLSAIGK